MKLLHPNLFICAGLFLTLCLLGLVQAERDYYEVLDLPKDTSARAIKKAYYKLSKKYHPDKNKDDATAQEKFIELGRAYEVLGDEEKRRIYDLEGLEGLKRSEGGGGGHSDPFDLFSQFFGGGGGRQHPEDRRGPSIHLDLDVSLEELYNGKEMDADISKWVICPKCRGTGAESDAHIHTCEKCQGSGVAIVRQMIAPGMYTQMQTTCDKCGGKGKTVESDCPVCSGHKVIRANSQITVVIEKGMVHEEKIVFERKGDSGADFAPGDLVFSLNLVRHATFTRDGNDLSMDMNITLLQALTGFSKSFTHLDGRSVLLERSEVTPSGFIQILQGEGMPHHEYPSEKGDMHVRYSVIYPKSIPEDKHEVLKEILAQEGEETE
ncbi:hypothetical protein BJ684DRAFT_19481 [Piptocephalis cylindrospora]|uniref:Uncharacterized protein n=1 Tax=Piptocephalis cylindrospora TaxID=1907219 RepID=A0A4P9Y5R9_9FUNG|nr:hypothetical protein BJ684DRAFT_19481 [Piptocephalis cylindrospora]|eukprot:RKP14082.1 hypothetical protein BJ684DRAFT_19481 [Piptocephalis cylindrospora]